MYSAMIGLSISFMGSLGIQCILHPRVTLNPFSKWMCVPGSVHNLVRYKAMRRFMIYLSTMTKCSSPAELVQEMALQFGTAKNSTIKTRVYLSTVCYQSTAVWNSWVLNLWV